MFLVENRLWREKLGSNARVETLAKFTWNRHVREIVDGLDRALSPV
jgi:hypothetical protein